MRKRGFSGLFQDFFVSGYRPYFWLAVTGFFLYFKTITFGLTHLDDNLLLSDNYWFLRDIGNIFRCFTQPVFLASDDLFYRPLLLVSFILDAQVGGTPPFVYHLTNIVLHVSSALLLFGLLIKLSYGRTTAFLLSAIFTVHPALAQAVAWIPGRNDPLLAVFAFPALIFCIRYSEGGKPKDLALGALFFNLALYSKETAVVLIAVPLLYKWLFTGNKLPFQKISPVIYLWALSAIAWFVLRNNSGIIIPKLDPQDFRTSLTEILPALAQYVIKIIAPFGLSVFPESPDFKPIYALYALPVVYFAVIGAKRENSGRALFGAAWFLVFILPTFALPDKMRFEHRLYLPIVGLLLFLKEIINPERLVIYRDQQKQAVLLGKNYVIALCTILIVILAGITFMHSDNFISRYAFWGNAARTSPRSASARNGLALCYLAKGKLDDAQKELNIALELAPQNVNVRINLGNIYTEKGMYLEAEKMYRSASKLKPDLDILFFNYGLLCYLEGRPKEALSHLEKAMRINNNFVYAFRALAAYHLLSGDTGKSGYYARLAREKFKIDVTAQVPAVVINRRKWFYDFCKSEM